MMATLSNTAYVLYVDHQGHPAPLSECFHATASRRLSSTADRIQRPSTVTQVDSAYCPQCLSFHDASSASQLGFCPKPTCLQCPLCSSIVSCNKIDTEFCYTCGRCSWNSLQCKISVESTAASSSEDEKAIKEEVASAVTKLAEILQERRTTGGKLKEDEEHYKNMISSWEGIIKPLPKTSASRSIRFKGRNNKDTEEVWSVDTLEVALVDKKKNVLTSTAESGAKLKRVSLDHENKLDSSLQGKPVESLALQALNGSPIISSMEYLLPLSVPLRSRKSRRCRAELAEGKPGILVKPKLNPLEGDSSLRTGVGQWWKKDSSAVHVLPKVRVVRCGSITVDDKQQHAFLLKVTNPTLGMVRLQLGLSTYSGESIWEETDSTKSPYLDNILVESLMNTHVDAFLLTPTNEINSLKSGLIELDSDEDALVDIGKVREIPEAVRNWDAKSAMANTPSSENKGSLDTEKVEFLAIKLLEKQSGAAWFELICATKPLYSNSFPAIPISLQLGVGNGSWESSLIKVATEGEGRVDMVSFDLVITWPQSSA